MFASGWYVIGSAMALAIFAAIGGAPASNEALGQTSNRLKVLVQHKEAPPSLEFGPRGLTFLPANSVRKNGQVLRELLPVMPSPIAKGKLARPLSEAVVYDAFSDAEPAEHAERERVDLLIAAKPGMTRSIAVTIQGIGGSVVVEYPEIGYLRATVPRSLISRLVSANEVLALEVDAPSRFSCSLDPDATAGDPPTIPLRASAAFSPFTPIDDMKLQAFQNTHPTYDGRGVTIAVIESDYCGGVTDFSHPSLQVARTASGNKVTKVIGIIDPATLGRSTPQVPHLRNSVIPLGSFSSARGAIRIDQTTSYLVPRAESWTFGRYKTSWAQEYGVIWNGTSAKVWIDTDQDFSFLDEEPVEDFNKRGQYGWLKRLSSRVPIAVVFDNSQSSLHVYEGSAFHHTMTAGMAAAHSITGGAARAAAPNAQIIIVAPSVASRASALEAVILAAQDPRVDLISDSWGVHSFTGVSAIIIDRLIEHYNKPMLFAAGNSGPSLRESLMRPRATLRKGLFIGAYESGATRDAFFGEGVVHRDNLWTNSARGPRLDGDIKPDLVAPELSIGLRACSNARRNRRQTLYTYPRCYEISGGTSAATPAAAGAVAALISGLKQKGAPIDAIALNRALRSSARFVDGYGAFEQGHGLIDVSAAWKQYKKLIRSKPVVIDLEIESSGCVGKCRGFFERDGFSVGSLGKRSITAVRRTGGVAQGRYLLRWRGNEDRTFSTSKTIRLPLYAPVQISLSVLPRGAGVHSAILQIIEAASGLVAETVSITIIVPHDLDPSKELALQNHLRWPDGTSEFIKVPPDLDNLSIQVGPSIVPFRMRVTPFALKDRPSAPQMEDELIPPGIIKTFEFKLPVAGVWEIRPATCDYSLPACPAVRKRRADSTIPLKIYCANRRHPYSSTGKIRRARCQRMFEGRLSQLSD